MAMDCGACKTLILGDKEMIKCSECHKSFHVGCTPIQTTENITKLGVSSEKWKCPRCSTNAENVEEFVDEVVTRSALEDVIGELRISSSQTTDAVVRDLGDVRKTVARLTKEVEEYKRSVEQVEEEISRVQKENSRLQTKNGNLWRTVVRLGDDLNDLQQLRYREPVEAARDLVNNDASSPKAMAALGLSCLTLAALLYLLASRVFKRAIINLLRNEE